MADIARMLSKLDKALLARSELKKTAVAGSELKKESIAKARSFNMAKYRAMGDKLRASKGGHTGNSDRGAGDRPWLDNTPRSPTGQTVNTYHFPAGLPYAKVDPKTGATDVVPRDDATPIPRIKEETGADGIVRMVPDVDPATGELKTEPMPYNGQILLDPHSNPRFMPVTYKVKKVPRLDKHGNPKLDENGEPIMRIAKDDLGRFIPELDENGNKIPLIGKDKKGRTVQKMMVNPDAFRSDYVVNATSAMRDAKKVNDLLENGATWEEAMDWLRRAQEAEIKNRDKDAWLKRLAKIFGEADTIGVRSKDENGNSTPRYAIDRDGMGWYVKTPEQKTEESKRLFGEDAHRNLHRILAEKALDERNPFFTPGMPLGREQEVKNPETGEVTRRRWWNHNKGPIEYLGPTSTLKRKHLRAFMDAVGMAEREADRRAQLRGRAEQMAASGETQPPQNLKDNAPVDYNDAVNMAIRLVQKNPDIWYDLLGHESDLEDVVRLFTVLPRSVSERFIETGTLSLKPVKSYTPSGRLSTGDVMRAKTINDDLRSRRYAAKNWLKYANNRNLAVRALEFFKTDEGKAFLEEKGYSNPNDLSEGDWQPIVDAAVILLNEENEEDRRIQEARAEGRRRTASELYGNVLDDAYDIHLPAGTTFTTLEGTPEREEELRKKQIEVLKRLGGRYASLRNSMRRGESAKVKQIVDQTRAEYPELSVSEVGAFLKTIHDRQGIYSSLDPTSKTGLFYRTMNTMLGNDPSANDPGSVQAMKEQYGDSWQDQVWGEMLRKLPTEVSKASNRLADFTQNVGIPDEKTEALIKYLNRLSNGDEYSIYAQWADSLRTLSEARAEMNPRINEKLEENKMKFRDEKFKPTVDGLVEYLHTLSETGTAPSHDIIQMDENGEPTYSSAASYQSSNATDGVTRLLYKYLADQLSSEASRSKPTFWPYIDNNPNVRRLVESALRHDDVNTIWSDLSNEAESTGEPYLQRMADAVESYIDLMKQKRAGSDDTELFEDKNLSKEGEWNEVMPEFRKLLQRKGFQGFDDLDLGDTGYSPMKYLLGDIGYDEVKEARRERMSDEDRLNLDTVDPHKKLMSAAVQPGDAGYTEKRIVGQIVRNGKAKNPKPYDYNTEGAYKDRKNADKPTEGDKRNWHNSNERERNNQQMLGGNSYTANMFQDKAKQAEAKNGSGLSNTPLTDEDKALATQARALAGSGSTGQNVEEAPKETSGETPEVDIGSIITPVVTPEQGVPENYAGKGLIEQSKVIGQQTRENRKKITNNGQKYKTTARGDNVWNSGASYPDLPQTISDSSSKKASIMEDMRNMSLRDMMDSIAKNSDKSGHPYGPSIGGSVFAFGCVPVNMGGDGRERGMPAEIPTAKTNDEGLTSKKVEMGRVRSDR